MERRKGSHVNEKLKYTTRQKLSFSAGCGAQACVLATTSVHMDRCNGAGVIASHIGVDKKKINTASDVHLHSQMASGR